MPFARLAPRRPDAILLRLRGGLGNQLFQYATGRAATWRLGCELLLDTSAYRGDPLRAFRLDALRISGRVASSAETLFPVASARLGRWIERAGLGRRWPILEEVSAGFDPRVLAIQPPICLQGYWQSERYFSDCRELLLEELQPRTPPPDSIRPLLDLASRAGSVAIHVRRGDYVSNPHARAMHGTLSPEWYESAVATLRQRVGSLGPILMFSDEPEWVQEHLPVAREATMASTRDSADEIAELLLMSRCNHQIIANSSFSWWGAWLNPAPDRMVIAPARWFAREGVDDRDVVPGSWTRL